MRIRRRTFLHGTALALAGVTPLKSALAAPGKRPNLLVISTDQHHLPTSEPGVIREHQAMPGNRGTYPTRTWGGPEDGRWRQYVWAYYRMIRSARYKYIRYSGGENPEQLFDLDLDPGEMTNLIAVPGRADVLRQHRDMLSAYIRDTGDYFPGPPPT